MMKLPNILQRTAHQFPDRPGITFEGGTRTWSELQARVERLAGGLETLGIAAGERLAILSHNSNLMAELFYGPLYQGLVPVPLNWRWAPPELAACLADCAPAILAVDGDHVEQARELAATCGSIEVLLYLGDGDAPEGFTGYDALLDRGEPVTHCPYGGEDLALIVYTGGTTGRAKGVMLSHTNLYINATNHLEFDSVGEGHSIVLSGPMFHISSCCRVYIHTFMAVHMVILPQFDALKLMENVQRYRITSLILISAMAALILDHPRYREFDLSSVRKINYGAAPMPPSLIARLQKEFPGVGFFHGYGATEAAGIISTLGATDHQLDGPHTHRLRSVGNPAGYIELRVVDIGGDEVEPGTVGEVVIRGPNVMQGYWQLPEATAEVLVDDWYHTGDAGYRDEDGYLYLVDRMKDMIISGGENIYSVEVERAIDLHPAIRQCAVVGRPDDTWGEVVHAVVSLEPGHQVTHEEIVAHCREHIAGYKCPRGLSIWDELPLSGPGKLLKPEIRKRLAGDSG